MIRVTRRILRYVAYAAAALVVLAVATVFVVQQLLDRPRMAAEIQAKLSSAVKGEVRWEEFRIGLLPAPHGTLRGLRVRTNAASLDADEVTLALRLWPLLLGRAEITSMKLAQPKLSLTIVPAATLPQEVRSEPQQDVMQGYRAAMSALTEALREFAPDTVVAVEHADVAVTVEGVPPLEFKNLVLRARTGTLGVELQATAASRYWTSMKLDARLEYETLASTAELQLNRIRGEAWLDWLLRETGIDVAVPDADLAVRFRTDGAKSLDVDLDGAAPSLTAKRGAQRFVAAPVVLKARLVADAKEFALHMANVRAGPLTLAGGALRYSPAEEALRGDVGYQLDLAPMLELARPLAPEALARIESTSGALRGRARLALRGESRSFGVTVEKSDAALQAKGLPPVRLTAARVEVDPRSVRVEGAAFSTPAGELLLSKLRYVMKDASVAGEAQFDIDVPQTLALVRGLLSDSAREGLAVLESAEGRVGGGARFNLKGKSWNAGLEIRQSTAQVGVRGLPAPVALTSASVGATPKAIAIERVSVRLLDTTGTASVTISDFERPRISGSLAQASVGPKLLAWVWQYARLPPGLEPKAPIRLAARGFAWNRGALDLQASAHFDAGPAIEVDLGWAPGALELRRAAIKDARSDATVSLATKAGALEGKYAGTLDSRTLAAMLKGASAPAGALGGELAFAFDRERAQSMSARGSLKAENLDLSWLAGKPAKIESMSLSAEGDRVRIGDMTLEMAGQRASLRGEVRRGPDGPVIDAQIESPGVVIDALLPPQDAQKEKAADKGKGPWPLPVSGKIAVRSKFVQYQRYKVEPLAAVVTLGAERAQLEVNEAFICGLAVPMTLEATPKGLKAATQILAQKQKLEAAAQCLAGEKVALSGAVDLRADLRTEGQPAELLQNLKGTVSADVRDGMVMKFALIGNILSMQNVVALVGQGGPKLGAEGFPFRQLSAKGRFDKGRFRLDEGVFHSNAIGLGANGWISLSDFQTRLTVLVAPLALVDEAVRKLPVLGYVIGGTFTSLPVSVSGDIRDPAVVPLGPRAITSELTGILGRTISLPGKLVPGGEK